MEYQHSKKAAHLAYSLSKRSFKDPGALRSYLHSGQVFTTFGQDNFFRHQFSKDAFDNEGAVVATFS